MSRVLIDFMKPIKSRIDENIFKSRLTQEISIKIIASSIEESYTRNLSAHEMKIVKDNVSTLIENEFQILCLSQKLFQFQKRFLAIQK